MFIRFGAVELFMLINQRRHKHFANVTDYLLCGSSSSFMHDDDDTKWDEEVDKGGEGDKMRSWIFAWHSWIGKSKESNPKPQQNGFTFISYYNIHIGCIILSQEWENYAHIPVDMVASSGYRVNTRCISLYLESHMELSCGTQSCKPHDFFFLFRPRI